MNRRGFMQTLFGGAVTALLPRQAKAKDVTDGKPLPQDVQDKLVSKMCNTTTTTDFYPKYYSCNVKCSDAFIAVIDVVGYTIDG